MFSMRLKALDYPDWDKTNGEDISQVKRLVSWLEDQKIRQYKIEDRKDLHNIDSDQWQRHFNKYLGDVGCPDFENQLQKIEWLIGLAVRLEYEDNCEKYKPITGKKNKNRSAPTVKSSNPIDNLDFQSKEFKDGVNDLAKLLKIPRHPDHLITLEACCKLVCKRLHPDALKNPDAYIVKGTPFPIEETSSGYDLGDPILNKAAKVLNLLYIQDLRDLQTQINEALVCVQNITANPKTDTSLGRVGR